jgi:hypothetical protein
MAGYNISWNETQRRIGECILRHRGNDDTYDLKAVQAELVDIKPSIIFKVAKALKILNWVIPPKGSKVPTPPKLDSSKTSDGVASTQQPQAGIIQGEVNGVKIRIEGRDFLAMFDQYRDMQEQLGWVSDFSSTIRQAMKLYRSTMFTLLEPAVAVSVVIGQDQDEPQDEEDQEDTNGGPDDTGTDS